MKFTKENGFPKNQFIHVKCNFSCILIFLIFSLNFKDGYCQTEIANANSFSWFNREFALKYTQNDDNLIDEHEIGFKYSTEPNLVAYTYNSNDEKVLFTGLSTEYSNTTSKIEPVILRAYINGYVYFELQLTTNSKYCSYVPLEMFEALFIGDTRAFLSYVNGQNLNTMDQKNGSKYILEQLIQEQKKPDPLLRKLYFIENTTDDHKIIQANLILNEQAIKIQDSLEKVVNKYAFEYENYLFLKEQSNLRGVILKELSDRREKKLNKKFSKRYGPVRKTLIKKTFEELTFLIETKNGYLEIPLKHQRFYSRKFRSKKLLKVRYDINDVLSKLVMLPADYLTNLDQLQYYAGQKKMYYTVQFSENNMSYKFGLNQDFLLNQTWGLTDLMENNIIANGVYLNGEKEGQWNEYLAIYQGKKCSINYKSDSIVNKFGECEMDKHHIALLLIISKIKTFTSFNMISLDDTNKLGWYKENVHLSLKKDDNEPLMFVDEEPVYPGGEAAMMAFIQNKLVYPQGAIENNLQGKCYLKFVVEEDGSITHVTVVRGVPECPECDKAAIKVVKSMPKWKPGKLNGRKMASYFQLPINFILE